jgi:NADH-quinone oxidoreductase subunit L
MILPLMKDTTIIQWLNFIPLFPLLGAIIAGFSPTFKPKDGDVTHALTRFIGHTITISGVAIALFLSLNVFALTYQTGQRFDITAYEWLNFAGWRLQVGFYIDNLSAVMMCVITSVSLMVHIYTIGYMAEDEGYKRFFSYISLFTFAMLMLVMSNNLLQLFFGWEAVGLVSYLLIGFWHFKPTASYANMKAFVVNRVGDFGFLLGIGLLAAFGHSLDYQTLFNMLPNLIGQEFFIESWYLGSYGFSIGLPLLTTIGICLFIGAMGKSAQFPLHVWLPDSMEGPTPISALIHAATMVTAGIFMVARFSSLYELTPDALNFILIIGSITALITGVLGVIQTDIKKVIAYSTLSQLGYMTMALGASAYGVAVFHLVTHAFFKALLFLSAGSVICGMHHEQDIRYMGNLKKYMPITWICSLIGTLALIGTPFLSGFYSKDLIIEALSFSTLPFAKTAHIISLIGVFFTAFYSLRLYWLVFHGQERYENSTNIHHDDHNHHDHDKKHKYVPHESVLVITLPLIALAIPSILLGFVSVDSFVFGQFLDNTTIARSEVLEKLHHHFHGASAMGLHAFMTVPFWIMLAGVVSAIYIYGFKPQIASNFTKRFPKLLLILENKYYFDQFNQNVISNGIVKFGYFLWQVIDLWIIDRLLVNGSAKIIQGISKSLKLVQSGLLSYYVLLMICALITLLVMVSGVLRF